MVSIHEHHKQDVYKITGLENTIKYNRTNVNSLLNTKDTASYYKEILLEEQLHYIILV